MKKFYANSVFREIKPIEIVRETEASVFLPNIHYPHGEERREKLSGDRGFFATFEDARSFLIGVEEEKIASLTRELGRRQAAIEKINVLEEAQP